MQASGTGHVEVVRWLLDRGAAMHERDDGRCTPLFLASWYGHPTVVQLLMERGADPAVASNGGMTPLVTASACGRTAVMECLLAHYSAVATINRRSDIGSTALRYACEDGYVEIVRLLLKHGADFTIASNDGVTPTAMKTRRECKAALKVRAPVPVYPPCLWSLLSWALTHVGVAAGGGEAEKAGGGAGLPPVKGPAGGGCGWKLRGRAGDGGEDARRGEASSRGGSAGRAEGACGDRGRGGGCWA
jgi:hypothetical protein